VRAAAAGAAAGSASAVGGEGAAAFTAEVLMVLSARDTRSSPAAAAARGAAATALLDAVPTLARATEILAPAKRAPRARSADMAMVDMLRWTERSRGRRWCAPMRLSAGEARLLEWLTKRHRRNEPDAWRNLSSCWLGLQVLSQSSYERNTKIRVHKYCNYVSIGRG